MLFAGSKTENAFPLTSMAGCRSKVAVSVVRYGVRAVNERPAGLIDAVRVTSTAFSFTSTTTALLSVAPGGVPNADEGFNEGDAVTRASRPKPCTRFSTEARPYRASRAR